MSRSKDKTSIMEQIRLKNMRSGLFLYFEGVSSDGVVGKSHSLKPGEIGSFNPDLKAIQIAVLSGDLNPTNKAGREWKDSLI